MRILMAAKIPTGDVLPVALGNIKKGGFSPCSALFLSHSAQCTSHPSFHRCPDFIIIKPQAFLITY